MPHKFHLYLIIFISFQRNSFVTDRYADFESYNGPPNGVRYTVLCPSQDRDLGAFLPQFDQKRPFRKSRRPLPHTHTRSTHAPPTHSVRAPASHQSATLSFGNTLLCIFCIAQLGHSGLQHWATSC